MTDDGYLAFIGAIIGGAISGAVGLVVSWYTNKLQDKDRLKNNVYRKLYDFIADLSKQNAPSNSNISLETWSRIAPYELINMDPNIKTEFDKLSKEIEPWNKFCNTLDYNYGRKETNIISVLQDAFRRNSVLTESGNIAINESNYSIDGILKPYLMVIVNPKINDLEMLYKTMSEFEQKYDPYHTVIAYLKQNKPLFFKALLGELQYLREQTITGFNYEDMMKQREIIQEHIKTLKNSLEKLAK